MEQTNKQEETLEDVIKSISKSLLKAGLSLLRVNIKYWYCIAVCLVIGVAIFFITKPQKQFNAEFIAQSFEVPALMIADEINTINNNGKDVVVKELGLDKADAEKLIGIAAFPVADFNGDRVMDKVIYSGVDETSQKYYFCIRITGDENCDFQKIGDAIIKRYNEDKKVKAISEYNCKVQFAELNGYKEELKKIDSLRFFYAKNDNLVLNAKDSVRIDMLSITEVQRLIETCASIEFALSQQREPLAAYTSIKISSSDNARHHLLTVLVISYLIGLAISYIIKNRKSIKEAIKED